MARKYKVTIYRTEYQAAEIEVNADSRADAINKAMTEADACDFECVDADQSVESVERVKTAKPKSKKKAKKGGK